MSNKITFFGGKPYKNYSSTSRSLILVSDLSRWIDCSNLGPDLMSCVTDEHKAQIVVDGFKVWTVDHNGAVELLTECSCDNCLYILSKIYS